MERELQWTLAYLAARIIQPQNFGSRVCEKIYMATKRKCTCVSLEAKLEIINRLKKGESQSSLASEYGIGKLTVGDFKKNEEKIREFVTRMESLDVSTKKRKVMRLVDDDTLDQALYLWFVQKRAAT